MSRDDLLPGVTWPAVDLEDDAGEAREAVTAWAAERIEPARPPAAVRERLLRTLEGPERFQPFFATIERLFDLTEAAVRGVMARIDEASGWSWYGDARYFHFQPGPRFAAEEAGVVRMAPGAIFPRHLHRGGEVTFVLDGLMHDRDRLHGPGSVVEAAPGSAHEYRAAGVGRDLILFSRHGGIEFLS